MVQYSEAEIQVLIALVELKCPIETPNNIGYTFYPKTLEEAGRYFRSLRLDWSQAYLTLSNSGAIHKQGETWALTGEGEAVARQARRERPPIYYWYREYFLATESSRAHAEYCRRLFGANLCQDGFAEVAHLDCMLDLLALKQDNTLLDLGCGNGMIAEYISDRTGAKVFGMDYIPEAIEQACRRTSSKRDRLSFRVGNLDHLPYPPESFDALISIDTLYMPNDLSDTLRQMKAILKNDGQMAIFYSHALWENPDYTKETLLPGRTPLAAALEQNSLWFEALDFTSQDYQHALRKKEIAEALKPAFEAEGNLFLYENKIAVAEGVRQAIETGSHVRYLYHVWKR